VVRIVFQKEMLSHLLSQRFAACTIVVVVLIIANGLLTTQTYVQKKANYLTQRAIENSKLHEITYYSVLGSDWFHMIFQSKSKATPRALHTPRPLAVFSQGDERQLGHAVKVLLFEVPYQAEEVSPFQSSNPYLAIFDFFDMVYIFQLVFSLLAILLASEAISGEKEDGTLRLMLTTNVSRAQVLAGKVLAGLTTLAIPTTLGFILLTILLLGTEHIRLGLGEWARLGLLFVLSLLYLQVFYLIGLAISCATHRSETSLIGALFAWALLAIVLPNSIASWLNEQANMGEKYAEAHHKAVQVWEEFDREVLALTRTHGQTDYYPIDMLERLEPRPGRGTLSAFKGTKAYSMRDGQTPQLYLSNVAASPALAQFQDIVRVGEHLRLQYAQQAWHAKAPLVEDFPRRIRRLNDQFQRLLPAGAYAQAASLLAGTHRREYDDFIAQVRTYREQIITFLKDHDAFGSREWFNDDDGFRADLRDLPRFHERGWTVADSLRHALPALTALSLYAAGLFVLINRLFAHYDAI